MSKNIAIFLDGTWNDKDKEDELSNVARLHDFSLNEGDNQLSYYDAGVGTDGWYDAKLGGIHGAGLSTNIKQAYTFLCQHYHAGDLVFIFGFSRGAYTARSLAGLIQKTGLLSQSDSLAHDVATLYEAYRDKNDTQCALYRTINHPCPIEFLGVWDTVGALGIPVGDFIRDSTAALFNFHDTDLGVDVKRACHAVAIDESRAAFEPTLWTVTPENRERIRQVLFAGVHSDIGGGYLEQHHSAVALHWMIQQAQDSALERPLALNHRYKEAQLLDKIDLTQDIHDSAIKLFGHEIATQRRSFDKEGSIRPTIHASVFEKLQVCASYWPSTLYAQVNDRETLSPFEAEPEERADA